MKLSAPARRVKSWSKERVLVLVSASGLLAATARATGVKDVVGIGRLTYSPGDGQTHEPVLTVAEQGQGLSGTLVHGDKPLEVFIG